MTFDVEAGAWAMLAYLDPIMPAAWDSRVLGDAEGLRMVAQYSFYHRPSRNDPEPLALIGKFYADGSGAWTYRVMRELFHALSQQTPLLAIPQPLFYDPVHQLLGQQHVEGSAYPELVGQDDGAEYLRLAGKALAELHAQPIALGRPRRLRDHLAELIRPHPARLQELLPEHAPAIVALIEAMHERERGWNGHVAPAPTHRDFHLRQLFYGQGRVWLIDWDLFATGDPALDLGNFVVYLQTHLKHGCDAAIRAFLEGYCTLRSPAILERVSLYMAFTYLRLACKRYRLQGPDWSQQVERMLRQAERCIEEKHGYVLA